jgi:hypothetical protein
MEDEHGPDSIHFSPFTKEEKKMLPTVNKPILTLKTDIDPIEWSLETANVNNVIVGTRDVKNVSS